MKPTDDTLRATISSALRKTTKRERAAFADKDWLTQEQAERAIALRVMDALSAFYIEQRPQEIPLAPSARRD